MALQKGTIKAPATPKLRKIIPRIRPVSFILSLAADDEA